MKVLLSWLNDFIDIKQYKIEDIFKRIFDIGIEIENIEMIESIRGSLENLIVGEIIKSKKHPNSDRLFCVEVNVGSDKNLNIVCGAPNVKEGLKVVVAKVGTTIHTFSGEDIVIEKKKIRGEESMGMLCAEDEIGLSNVHDKIIELDKKSIVGEYVSNIYNVNKDFVFNVDITPNRGYALSHLGISRDVSIVFNKKIKLKKEQNSFTKIKNLEVNIDSNDICDRYCCALVKNVKIKESPKWIQTRLQSVGIRAINNIVDITNYIMMSFGQPLHSYDFDEINGNIYVRKAKKDEKFKALDKKIYSLDEDVVVCDKEKILGLGGIIGGLNSSIKETTKNIFFESAIFNSSKIRISSQRLGLKTEASYRFERGVDYDMSFYCLQKAIEMLQEQQNDIIIEGFIDVKNNYLKQKKIEISLDYINEKIGQKLDGDLILNTLNKLDINVEKINDGCFICLAPIYRQNIKNKSDIVDELLRIIGFNKIEIGNYKYNFHYKENKLPYYYQNKIENKIGAFLRYNNFSEIITSPFISHNICCDKNAIHILNSSDSEDTMRTNLLFSGLKVIKNNINHCNKFLKLFEFGKIYFQPYEEKKCFSIFTTGEEDKDWFCVEKKYSFFDFKKIIYNLFYSLGLNNIYEEKITEKYLFKLKIGNVILGIYGFVDENILNIFDINQQVFFSEIYFDELITILKNIKWNEKFKKINNYPVVKRDLSFLFDKDIKYIDVKKLISKLDLKNLVCFKIFDVFIDSIKTGNKKGYSFSFYFQSENHTLTDKEIKKEIEKIIDNIVKTFSAQLRAE